MVASYYSVPYVIVGCCLSLVIGAVLLPWRGGLRTLTGERALAYERRKRQPVALPPPPDSSTEALSRLDGPDALIIGTHMGRPVNLKSEIARRSALILGASGSGKSFWVLSALKALILAMVTGLSFEIAMVDAKNESVDLLRQVIGGWLLTFPERQKEWLRRHVRVIMFGRDRVTPLRPYDNLGSAFTDSYTASFRTAVTVDAGTADYTDGTRHARAMLDRVLTDLRWPLSSPVAVRFFTDTAFQNFVASRVRDGHLRSFIHTMAVTVPKGTAAAVCRRVDREMSDPHMRAAKGVPPAALDKLLPVIEPGLTLARVGPDRVLTPTTAQDLCLLLYFELLASVPTRSTSLPLLIVAEELAATVAGSPRLVLPITQLLRTSRSFGVALWALAQDFENAATVEMATSFVLNARFLVAFASREEASWLASHVPPDFAPGLSDSERKRAFLREMERLPARHFFLWVKGEDLLRCQSLDVPVPSVEFGRSAEELTEVFDREIGSRSTITLEKAEELIAEFEADVLGKQDVVPAPDPKSVPPITSMDDLLRHLDDDEESHV